MQLGYYVLRSRDHSHFSWHQITDKTASHPISEGDVIQFFNTNDQVLKKMAARLFNRFDRFADFLQSDNLSFGSTGFLIEQSSSKSLYRHMQIGDHHHFIHAQGIKHFPVPITHYSRINIVSGICLFGLQAIYAVTEDDRHVNVLSGRIKEPETSIHHFYCDPHPSLYEIESIYRLSRLIVDMVSILPTHIPITITIDIPRIQYFINLLYLIQSKKLSFPLFTQWMELVNQRCAMIQSIIIETIHFFLSKVTDKKMENVSLSFSEEFQPVEDLIVNAISSTRIPTLTELVTQLSEQDDMWSLIFKIDPPQTYRELSYQSYVMNVLRKSLRKKVEPTEILLEIENSLEKKIYDHAKHYYKMLMRKYTNQYQMNLVGLYPLELIFASPWKNTLYFQESDHELKDDEGNVYSIFSVLEKIYKESHHEFIEKIFHVFQ